MLSDIKKILTLHCDESAELLSKQQDVPLSRVERTALRLHLFVCRACRRYNRQLQFIRNMFMIVRDKENAILTELKMSEEKQNQIKSMINQQFDT